MLKLTNLVNLSGGFPPDIQRISNESLLLLRSEVGIYKRKQESEKTRKQELDQESDQENKKTRTKKAIKKTREKTRTWPRKRPRKY